MTEAQFKSRAETAGGFDDIDRLCLEWLRDCAMEQAPKVREMLLECLSAVRKGVS